MRVTPEQSVKVQEICFKNGIYWVNRAVIVMNKDEPYIIIDKEKYLSWLGEDQSDSFIEAEEEKIDPELFIRTNGTCIEKREAEMKHNEKMENIKEWNDTTKNQETKQPTRGDGGSTNYYELPKGATELRHLIRYKKMSHSIGEIFCAIYRLKDNCEYLRNLKKAKFYIDSEIEEYEKEKTK